MGKPKSYRKSVPGLDGRAMGQKLYLEGAYDNSLERARQRRSDRETHKNGTGIF